jgi:competence protein ComFC
MHMLDRFISLLAPHCCVLCGAEGSILCPWCSPEVVEPIPPRCYRCKKISPDYKTCASCRSTSRLRNVWVASDYNGAVKQTVHAYKFERARAAAHPIAEIMSAVLPYFDNEIIVTHISTATSRRRLRGYDHAELLAKQIAAISQQPYRALLARSGQTRQVGASRDVRLKQLAGAFRVVQPQRVKGRSVLLVDDITTTGATLESAAELLRTHGAKHVDAVVFAQKQ